MILAVDVHYRPDGSATVAGVLFTWWGSAEPSAEIVLEIDGVAQYVPGAFFLRELPCIRRLLAEVSSPMECIVIDGYVFLGRERRPGLGMHLWNELDGKVAVIGVAKTRFLGTADDTRLIRGGSRRPLHITSAGISLTEAKACVAEMKGPHRIPDLLRRVDRLSRRGSVP